MPRLEKTRLGRQNNRNPRRWTCLLHTHPRRANDWLEVAIQGQGGRQVVHVFIHLEIVAHIEKRVAKRIKLPGVANGKTKVVRNGVELGVLHNVHRTARIPMKDKHQPGNFRGLMPGDNRCIGALLSRSCPRKRSSQDTRSSRHRRWPLEQDSRR